MNTEEPKKHYEAIDDMLSKPRYAPEKEDIFRFMNLHHEYELLLTLAAHHSWAVTLCQQVRLSP